MAFSKAKSTMTSLSSTLQENLATFVLAAHSADNLFIHLATVRVMESPQCVVVKKDMVVLGVRDGKAPELTQNGDRV